MAGNIQHKASDIHSIENEDYIITRTIQDLNPAYTTWPADKVSDRIYTELLEIVLWASLFAP